MINLFKHYRKEDRALKNLFRKIRLDIVVLFVFFFSIFIYLQFSKTIGDPDGFYHAKIAILLGQGKLYTALPWMQFSTLKEAFTDHHWLYHIALIPFVKLGNPLMGVKLAAAFFSAGFFTLFYWLLRRWRIGKSCW